ncbi:MAG TPA: hypothetical protein VHD82_26130 [Amycolatopsis sp.]|nr:hypothetical protein [Amycolatopsis sp.]
MPPGQAAAAPPPQQQQQAGRHQPQQQPVYPPPQQQPAPHGGQVLGAPYQGYAPPTTAVAPPPAQQRQQAAAQALATTVETARPLGLSVAAPPAPPGHRPTGGGPSPVVPDQREWRQRRHRAIPRLRIGWHQASATELDRLQVAGASFGLRLGRNQSGFPVALALFQPEPTTVMLIGGAWAARLLAYRALGYGARVKVLTAQPKGWSDLGRSATGRTDRVAVLPPGSPVETTASADAPVLVLHDTEQPPSATEPVAWETRLTVLRRLTPDNVAAMPNASIVMMQRLTPSEAQIVASAMRLTPRTSQQLPMLRDDMMAVLSETGNHYVWLGPGKSELELIGRPGRY